MSSKCFERLTLQADACGVTRLQARALLQIRQRTEISVIPARTRRCAINEIDGPKIKCGKQGGYCCWSCCESVSGIAGAASRDIHGVNGTTSDASGTSAGPTRTATASSVRTAVTPL